MLSKIIKQLRIALSTVLTPKAVSIQLESHPYGVKSAVINDQDLLYKAEFILAVSARVPEEILRKQFIHQIKITTPDKIRQLVSVQLPGIELKPLVSAPRQLPYHAGYTYSIWIRGVMIGLMYSVATQSHSMWQVISLN